MGRPITCFSGLSRLSSSHSWFVLSGRLSSFSPGYDSNDNPSSLFTNSCISALLRPPGLGARCMPGNPVRWFFFPFFFTYLNFTRSVMLFLTIFSEKKCVPVEENFSNLIPKYNVSALPSASKECKCAVGTLWCPEGAGGPTPPSMLTSTTDMMTNMTDRNISDWLLKTRKKYYKQR